MNTLKDNFNNVENTTHPTMQDVAKLAGVSIATVSHVVNNTGAIGEETRQRIRFLINSVGYEPNIHAKELAMGRIRKTKLPSSPPTV